MKYWACIYYSLLAQMKIASPFASRTKQITHGLVFILFTLIYATALADNGLPPFHFQDSSGKTIEYYPIGYLFLQENDMVGRYAGGSFTIIKKVNKNGWLVEASEPDMPTTKILYLKIPKNWDIQTLVQSSNGFSLRSELISKFISQTGRPPFKALKCIFLVVLVTDGFMKFSNTLDDTEDSVRVVELKAISTQPCM